MAKLALVAAVMAGCMIVQIVGPVVELGKQQQAADSPKAAPAPAPKEQQPKSNDNGGQDDAQKLQDSAQKLQGVNKDIVRNDAKQGLNLALNQEGGQNDVKREVAQCQGKAGIENFKAASQLMEKQYEGKTPEPKEFGGVLQKNFDGQNQCNEVRDKGVERMKQQLNNAMKSWSSTRQPLLEKASGLMKSIEDTQKKMADKQTKDMQSGAVKGLETNVQNMQDMAKQAQETGKQIDEQDKKLMESQKKQLDDILKQLDQMAAEQKKKDEEAAKNQPQGQQPQGQQPQGQQPQGQQPQRQQPQGQQTPPQDQQQPQDQAKAVAAGSK